MIAWYVCVLVVSIVALGFVTLGAALASKKLRRKLENERDTIGRDIVLRHLNNLRSVIEDKIAADEKLANENLAEALSMQGKTIKTYVDAFIWLLSLEK